MRHAASAAAAAAAALGLLLLAACAAPAQAALVLPITFQPIQGANDSVLFPLYANVSLFGAWDRPTYRRLPPSPLLLAGLLPAAAAAARWQRRPHR